MGLAPALRRRRRLRAGMVQLVYLLAAIGLGLLVPRVSVGATVDSRRATEMVRRRVDRLLAGLIAIAPAFRAQPVQARIERTRP
jgi:hypothetical protein